MKKQQSAPDLRDPCPSVFEIIHASKQLQLEDDRSTYSDKVQKYEIPEYKIDIPLTPQPEKQKLFVPYSTGRISEKLPKMNQVPALFDILVSPRSESGSYTKQLSKEEEDRIYGIMHPPMDDDEISEVSTGSRKRSSSKTKKKTKSSDGSVSSGRRDKLEKSNSLPSLLGACDDEEEEEIEPKMFARSSSDRALCSNYTDDLLDAEDMKEDAELAPRSRSTKRSSSKKKLKKSASPSKTLKKSSSCPSLEVEKKKKKKTTTKKLKKSSSDRTLDVEGKKKRRHRRANSTSDLMDDPDYLEEAKAIKAQVEDMLRRAQLGLEQGSDIDESSTSPEEERIRQFAEAQRRSASLSPSRFQLGDIDGYRIVETNDRKFRNKSWRRVSPSPKRTLAESPRAPRFSAKDMPPLPVSVV